MAKQHTVRTCLGAILQALSLVAGVWTALFATPASALAQQSAVRPPSRPPLVFDGVTVIDVERGIRRPSQRVVIADTRIAAVGDAAQIKIPDGAQVVNAAGKYLVPGFWDMHIHPFDAYPVFYPLFLANGVTGIRDAGNWVPLATLRAWHRSILAGEHVGPVRQFLAGPSISEQQGCNRSIPGMFRHMTCVADPDDARHLVDSLKAAGADMIKIYGTETPAIYAALVSEAKRVGLLIGGHLNAPAFAAVDSGVSLMDHSFVGDMTLICFNGSASEGCPQLAERMVRQNSWEVPTAAIWGGPTPMYVRTTEHIAAFWADTAQAKNTTANGSSNWLHNTVKLPPPGERGGLVVAQESGLPIVVGTDVVSNSEYEKTMGPGWGVHEEMATMVATGMTPLGALQAGTINPAKALRIIDSLGTVTTGKLADLVLLDADPLEDITNTTTIVAVVANGRYFDRPALDDVMATVRRDRLAQGWKP